MPPVTLQQSLDLAWTAHSNIPLPDVYETKFMTLSDFLRMQRFLDALIDGRESLGHPTRVVCVAAHRYYGGFAIEYLLKRGITVVSRESQLNHTFLLGSLTFRNLAEAVASRKLVCSSFDCEPHPINLPYDLSIWMNPGGLMGSVFTDNLAEGGWLLVQHHVPLIVGEGAFPNRLYTRNKLNPSDYLFPSAFLYWPEVGLDLFDYN